MCQTGCFEMTATAQDATFMQRALHLAQQGQGRVEPNPMVGCVITRDGAIVGEGFHTAYGKSHAEVEAIQAAGTTAKGGSLYVNLEPCCHQGKTPPCTRAIMAAGLKRVIVGNEDPFDQVAGGGLAELRAAGIDVVTGIAASAARKLNAPYFHRLATGRPWVIAKWAMTLDGKIATGTGESRWISSEPSREIVHRLRGRVDAVIIGSRTALADDPLLTARPAGPRLATRIILDSNAALSLESQLAKTAGESPVLVVTGPAATAEATKNLAEKGCEILQLADNDPGVRLQLLLSELGKRGMANLLVEGGSQLLGSFFDQGLINEVHTFIAPILLGGNGLSAIGGHGVEKMAESWKLEDLQVEQTGGDIYLQGRLPQPKNPGNVTLRHPS